MGTWPVRALCSAGASTVIRNKEGAAALDIARRRNQPTVTALLERITDEAEDS
eukprot:m.35583 g.35583  ORF g.35583 m.35583 type:complete len:53 (-) comp44179_c0_seq1:63-221(-)